MGWIEVCSLIGRADIVIRSLEDARTVHKVRTQSLVFMSLFLMRRCIETFPQRLGPRKYHVRLHSHDAYELRGYQSVCGTGVSLGALVLSIKLIAPANLHGRHGSIPPCHARVADDLELPRYYFGRALPHCLVSCILIDRRPDCLLWGQNHSTMGRADGRTAAHIPR